ncbi:MAG: TrbC/VirB2 family protein [Clostridia bacterium]|nr:TrbC/VirB2 family protein [Clostridia bacterium]
MRKTKKIFLILIITFLLVNVFNVVFALNPDNYKPSTVTADNASELTDKVGVVLGAIRNISVVVSVIALMIIGLKYMFGSVEEKANYKATLGPYVIGFILAISGTTLVSFIYNAVH